MKKRRNIIALTLVMVLLLSAFAGCGGTTTPSSTASSDGGSSTVSTPSGDQEQIVINFLGAQYSDATEGYIKYVIEEFEKQHENVTINLEIAGWDNIGTRINAMVGSKQAPDIYNGGSATQFVGDDLLYKAEDVISTELRADFFETFWNNNVDPDLGEAYQIPYLATVRALYYNKAIFEEVGIEAAPVTWKEVEEVCQQIHDFYNGEVYAWGLDCTMTEGQTTIAYYGWNNGGGYVDENGNYIINCDANVEAFEWIYDLYQKGYTNENPTIETRDDMQKLVASNKMAMLISACFFPALYPDLDLGIAPAPYNDAAVSESSTMAVQDALVFFNENAKASTDSPEKMAAIREFLDFFYSPEMYVDFMMQEGTLPATISGAELLVERNPEQAAYIEALNGAKFYARSKQNWADCSTGLMEVAQKVFTDMQTPREALDELQAILEG